MNKRNKDRKVVDNFYGEDVDSIALFIIDSRRNCSPTWQPGRFARKRISMCTVSELNVLLPFERKAKRFYEGKIGFSLFLSPGDKIKLSTRYNALKRSSRAHVRNGVSPFSSRGARAITVAESRAREIEREKENEARESRRRMSAIVVIDMPHVLHSLAAELEGKKKFVALPKNCLRRTKTREREREKNLTYILFSSWKKHETARFTSPTWTLHTFESHRVGVILIIFDFSQRIA